MQHLTSLILGAFPGMAGMGANMFGAGMPGAGMPGAGMPGAGMPGAGMPGAGMPGGGMPGGGMPDLSALFKDPEIMTAFQVGYIISIGTLDFICRLNYKLNNNLVVCTKHTIILYNQAMVLLQT